MVQHRMKASPQAVFGEDFDQAVFLAPITAETKPAEDRIIRQYRGGRPQRAAIAEVDFAGVIPRAAKVRLARAT